mgnify:CR=1 FL=1
MRVAMMGQYPLDAGRILGGVEAVMVPLLHGLVSFAFNLVVLALTINLLASAIA